MASADEFQAQFDSLETRAPFAEATVTFRDGTRLRFCHRVRERWARAVDASGKEDASGLARRFLESMAMFRLNAKHLDINFSDGSRWERKP